jgi:hypothetical protein
MTLDGSRVYVLVDKYTGIFRVVLPGDAMDITDRLTELQMAKVKNRVSKEERS